MARPVLNSACLMLMATAILISMGWKPCSSLQMTVSPEISIVNVDGRVDFSCAVDHNNTREILLLQIFDNKHSSIVMVRPHLQPSFSSGNSNSNRFLVRGAVDNEANDSYLNLTLLNPRQEDGGEYKCTVFYLDDGGIMTEKSAIGTLVAYKLDIKKTYFELQAMGKTMAALVDKVSNLYDATQTGSCDMDKLMDRLSSLEEELKKHKQKESSLQARILNLEIDNKNMLTEIDRLNSSKSSLQESVSSLKKSEENMEIEIVQLKEDNMDMATKITGLIEKVNTTESSFQIRMMQIEKDNNRMFSEISSLKNDSQDMSSKISGLIRKEDDVPAFNALLTKKVTLRKGQTIIFDNALLNLGKSGYNEKTGVFTAPQTGLYLFFLYVTITDYGAEVVLLVNGHSATAIHTYESSRPQWDQSNVNVLLKLHAGDEVKVMTYIVYGASPTLDNSPFSMFGGYFIH